MTTTEQNKDQNTQTQNTENQDQNTQNTDPIQDQNTENQDVEDDKPGFFTRAKEAVFGWMVNNPKKTFLIGGFALAFTAFKMGQRSGVKKERKRVEKEAEEKQSQIYNRGLNDGERRGGNDRSGNDRFNDRDKDRQHA